MALFDNKEYGFISKIDLMHTKGKILYFAIFAFIVFLVAICMLPPIWVLVSSLKETKEFFSVPATFLPKEWHFEKLREVWDRINFSLYFKNSLIVVGGSIASAMVFNGLLAYAISILRPKGSKIIYALILMSMMIPATINTVFVYKMIIDFGLKNNYLALWLSPGAVAFNVILYKEFFDSIPISYIEAARIDGCSKLRIFLSLILPMSKPVNACVFIFTLNAAWSDFLMPMLVLSDDIKRTVIVKLYSMSTLPDDYIITAMVFIIIPPIILFLIFQKSILGGLAVGGIKG